ncbi:Vacuolar import/degradation protein Vid24 like protein [Aduncisulcus paluster]|uniref:Vacuolar import/degradation protein Vid24 like protein n=1 Tax=Aduncisulcus paluster TaxID=2918883 RepID=A0ABQ5K7Y2_9EUKA|nr:Vacuolar import/degradation protein Vid24 like protein [Aduncisulcus paluster]
MIFEGNQDLCDVSLEIISIDDRKEIIHALFTIQNFAKEGLAVQTWAEVSIIGAGASLVTHVSSHDYEIDKRSWIKFQFLAEKIASHDLNHVILDPEHDDKVYMRCVETSLYPKGQPVVPDEKYPITVGAFGAGLAVVSVGVVVYGFLALFQARSCERIKSKKMYYYLLSAFIMSGGGVICVAIFFDDHGGFSSYFHMTFLYIFFVGAISILVWFTVDAKHQYSYAVKNNITDVEQVIISNDSDDEDSKTAHIAAKPKFTSLNIQYARRMYRSRLTIVIIILSCGFAAVFGEGLKAFDVISHSDSLCVTALAEYLGMNLLIAMFATAPAGVSFTLRLKSTSSKTLLNNCTVSEMKEVKTQNVLH